MVGRTFLLLFSAALTTWAAASPEIVLSGHVASRDTGSYRMLPFQVPQGTKRLNVSLTFTGQAEGTQMYLGAFDPSLYRGAGRIAFTISEYDATPPFSPGPILPGEWKLLLAIANVMPGKASDFTIHITLLDKVDGATGVVIRPVPGWYKGDLHSHTGHSDGACLSQSGKKVPCPAHRLIEAASSQHLDFLAVTDHNTASTLNQIREMQPYFDNILLIHGREMTTFNGHANVWGTAEFLDYRIGLNGWTINNFLDQVHRTSALVSINHAYWPVGPSCPGCGWGWKDQTDFGKIDAIEAINGYHEKGSYFTPPPGNGVPFWEEQVALGHRITAVGGGDDHRSGEQLDLGIGVGHPTTVVYARELSEPAILEGIKAGHVFIQVGGPQGAAVRLTSGSAMMGDVLQTSARSLPVQIQSDNCQDCKGVLYLDGKRVYDWQVPSGSGTQNYTVETDGGRHWIRAELISTTGELAALTNPIYVNY